MNLRGYSLLAVLLIPAWCRVEACQDALKPDTPIEAVGSYRSKSPNAGTGMSSYMIDIDLWHADQCYFGYFRATRSREGDAPAGVLHFVLPRAGGAMSFNVKLSDGVVDQGPGLPGIPARDFFEFNGFMQRTKIVGSITYTDRLLNTPPVKQHTVLHLQKKSAHELNRSLKSNTFMAWTNDAQSLLRLYGPKW